ncbi:MAG TPA: hypothetical protein VGH99_02535 [Pseudonocardia sp.]|jgi:hypothetical protein
MSHDAPRLCERCWQQVHVRDRFVRLGHVAEVRPDGEPVFHWSYLHAYDPGTGYCADVPAAA